VNAIRVALSYQEGVKNMANPIRIVTKPQKYTAWEVTSDSLLTIIQKFMDHISSVTMKPVTVTIKTENGYKNATAGMFIMVDEYDAIVNVISDNEFNCKYDTISE